ncbi:MAG: AraC family transcriptional regulator [Verrucomicrobiota bacterium]
MTTVTPRANGTAVELIAGQRKQTTYYGTFKDDLPDPNFRFKIATVDETDEFPLHSHEYEELGIVLAGRAIHLTECENYTLEAGDVFVIHARCRHGLIQPQGLKMCLLLYDPRQLLGCGHDLRRMAGFHALFSPDSRAPDAGHFRARLHLSSEQIAYVRSLTATMNTEFEGHSDGRQTIIKSTFLLLAAYLSRLYQSPPQGTGAPLARLANVVAHIRKNFREPLAIGTLARLAHWSPSHFQRNFKRVYHTTPNQFITRVRLEEAAELLKDPDRDITSIAYETGFASSSFFTIRFKRHFGETPSEFRRQKLVELETMAGMPSALRP